MLFIFGPFFYALLLLISLPFPLIPTSPLHFLTLEPHLHSHHSITHFSLDFHTHLSTAHIPFFSNLHAHPSLQPFPNPSIKITLHHQPIKEAALGNTPTIAFCDTDSPMQCVALLLRDHTAAAIAHDSAAVFAWKGEILQELFSRHRGPGAVHQAWRIYDPRHRRRCRRGEVAKV